MRLDLSQGLPENVLAKIRKHSAGAEHQETRFLGCHYCEHKTIKVYEDSRGHVEVKCKKCGQTALYNVVLRRGRVTFCRVT